MSAYLRKPLSTALTLMSFPDLCHDDSDTPLAAMVQSPQLVRDIDWLNRCWPENRKQEGQFPKVGGVGNFPRADEQGSRFQHVASPLLMTRGFMELCIGYKG